MRKKISLDSKKCPSPFPGSHDLDLEAIDRAVTPLTRAILINSPNNPTGKVYSKEMLADLGKLLSKRSSGRDSPIFLISDEAYCRIVFEGTFAPSPVSFYDYSLLVYTFGKSTLAPGERMGYIALSPRMKLEDREAMRESITRACMTGNVSDTPLPFFEFWILPLPKCIYAVLT